MIKGIELAISERSFESFIKVALIKHIMINTFSFVQKAMEFKYLLNNNSGKVLLFHQVDDKSMWQDLMTSITPDSFVRLINSLWNSGHHFVSLQKIMEIDKLNSRNVALTFDDGCRCLNDFVSEFLIEKQIPFTIFVTIEFINKQNYLTEEQLLLLSKNGLCDIGSHSFTHPVLRKLDDENSKYEIKSSKDYLEKLLSMGVEYFAYPYGSVYAVSQRDITYAKEAGYKLSFSSVTGSVGKNSLHQRWFLPRINVNELNYTKFLKG